MTIVMNKMHKVVHRISRILIGKKGIYCKYGKHTRFMKGIEADEDTVIGDYTYVGRYTTITKSKIGRYCSIAPYVTIGPGEHDINCISTSARISTLLSSKHSLVEGEVIIGNDVWIGVNAIILRGINVGNGAIIAAGAVVNEDVPDYAIVGGIPARIIRYRKSEEWIEKISKSNWWDYDPETAIQIMKECGLLEDK